MKVSAVKLAAYVLRKVAVTDYNLPAQNVMPVKPSPVKPSLNLNDAYYPRDYPVGMQTPARAPQVSVAPAPQAPAAPAPQTMAAKTAPKAAPAGGKGVLNLNAPQNKAQAAKYSPALIQKWNQQYAAKHPGKGQAPAAPATKGFNQAAPQGMAWLDPYLRNQVPAEKAAPKAAPARPAPRSITTPAQDEGAIAKYLSTPAAAPRQVRDTEIARRASPPGKGRGITG